METINNNPLHKRQGKDTQLNPNFDDLQKPETIKKHVQELTKKDAIPHDEILEKLVEQIEPVNFKKLAFPQIEKFEEKLKKFEVGSDDSKAIQKQIDEFKLNQKHLLILSIENILQNAEKKFWGLCKNHDFIYLYNGTFWNDIDKETFQKFLGEASEKIGVTKFDARFYHFREKLFKQFLATAYLPTPESDKDKVLINLLNGTFEISQKETILRPFKRSDFLTYQLPFEYSPKATAPAFEAYLDKVLPDVERQKVLAEYLGFLFIKHGSNALKEEKVLILYGTGANGKSVFFEIVNALLGTKNISNYSLQSLTDDKGYQRAKLANTLVNYGSEINGNLETSIFKQLVSGEPVDARLPYGQPFILKQYAKLIFNCNELPKDVEHTNAYFRRFLIIPFDVTIPPQEQDKNLHTKIIKNELSGVFNWVLDGLNRLLEQKQFSKCDAAQNAVEQYKLESNSVQMFLSENEYKSDAKNYSLIKDLYIEYKAFCIEDGMTPFKKSNFIKQLRSLKIIVDRLNVGNVAYLSNDSEVF
jgi:putative DNA primase/helicase